MEKSNCFKKILTALILSLVMVTALFSNTIIANASTSLENISIVCYLTKNYRVNTNTNTNSSTTIKEDTYFIETALKNGMVLDVSDISKHEGANIHIWNNVNGENQKFKIKKSGNYYTITALHSGKVVDVSNGSTASGTNVQQWTSNNTNAQKWKFIDAGNGYYYIQSVLGNYLDVSGGYSDNGTNVQVYTGNKTNAQKWKLISVSAQNNTRWQMPMDNAYCTWKSKENWSWATYTNRSGNRDYHLGIDIYGTNGNVYATTDGKIVAFSSSNSEKNGRYIIIQHKIDGKTLYSFYAHLRSLNNISKGKTIRKGTKIGIAGGSGYGKNNYYSTHLHFAIVDTLLPNGSYYKYTTKFNSNKFKYSGVTYYNPIYVIHNNKVP